MLAAASEHSLDVSNCSGLPPPPAVIEAGRLCDRFGHETVGQPPQQPFVSPVFGSKSSRSATWAGQIKRGLFDVLVMG